MLVNSDIAEFHPCDVHVEVNALFADEREVCARVGGWFGVGWGWDINVEMESMGLAQGSLSF